MRMCLGSVYVCRCVCVCVAHSFDVVHTHLALERLSHMRRSILLGSHATHRFACLLSRR